jgi:hypothetical protein
MLKFALWALALIAALALVDRLLLWMEEKGWLYYRRTRGRGGGAIYHMMETHSTFDPGIQEVIEAKYHEEKNQDESGDPPE